MKVSALISLAIAASVSHAHTIFQKVSVNGAEQGQLFGVRAPDSDYPIQDVNDSQFACNKDIRHKDNNVISIQAGAKVGAWWGHVIGGPQSPNDPDHPIAKSHKGPIMVYLAKVSNAASSGTSGLQWFKISEEGLSGGQWAVDKMISQGGWNYFTMPTCIAPGDYLMRVELLALHSASTQGQAQFYMECAQIRVTGSGSNTGSNFVSFPGAYKSNDPGILLSIYDNSGNPNNGGRAYTIPGPKVLSCSGSGSNGGGGTTPPPSNEVSAPLYGQCGGTGWTGPTTCASGTCKASGDYYSQCLP